jgi:hypothetical protein
MPAPLPFVFILDGTIYHRKQLHATLYGKISAVLYSGNHSGAGIKKNAFFLIQDLKMEKIGI